MVLLFANNALSKLAQPLLVGQTTVTIQAGTGALFPSPSGGDYFKLTIEDRRTQQIEIMHCIGRSGDVLTVVRAREDMSAQNFLVGATVSNRFTRDTPDEILDSAPNANPWYLGPFAAAPTTDNDGGPLQTGMSYFNTGDTRVYYWTGASWVDPFGVGNITSASGVFVLQDPSGDFDGVETEFDLRYTDYSAVTQTPDTSIAEQFVVWLDGVAQRPGVDYIIPAFGTIEFTVAPAADVLFHGVWIALTNGLPGSGTGDMTRAVYDQDNDGTVDFAENVEFTGVVNVPTERFLGRLTAGTGPAEALSKAQAKSALDIDDKLDLAGGTMTGDINADGNEIVEPVLRQIGISSGLPTIAAGVVVLDFATHGDMPELVLTEDITDFSISGWPPSGIVGKMTVIAKQDVVGGWAFALPDNTDNYFWPSNSVPVVTADPEKFDIFVFVSRDGGATVLATVAGQNYGN